MYFLGKVNMIKFFSRLFILVCFVSLEIRPSFQVTGSYAKRSNDQSRNNVVSLQDFRNNRNGTGIDTKNRENEKKVVSIMEFRSRRNCYIGQTDFFKIQSVK